MRPGAYRNQKSVMGLLELELCTVESYLVVSFVFLKKWAFLYSYFTGKKLQGKYLRIVSSVSPAKLYGCYAVIAVLTAAVIALTVTLSEKEKKERVSIKNICAVCPKDWIGFRSKCFYFSEDMRNWTFSQTFCMAQEAHLAQFDSLDELNFLMRYKGDSAHWIGLHRESTQHPWRWTDNTEYNNLVPIRGEGERAYLSDRGISNGRDRTPRKWICSKPDSYLQYPEVS
ncbi:C-type lectin domain family 2 member E-like [Peromyscus californicus insignis]|uniref:C-type lectin domain family 2 member E-like n=1 Tax=Peromyscus californicus insignis TaxID=564181 RepID=UPI0022A66836|nr:C-type lectin domain family 2 member E-like [Peromyscus californicus insignis]